MEPNHSIISLVRSNRRSTVLAAFVLSVLVCLPLACRDARSYARPTVIYLVRHAEKAPSGDNNPPLSDAGARRAEALAQTLGDAGVSIIYCTQFKRTMDTAAPLAARTGVAVKTMAVNHDDPQAYVEGLARDITAKHGGEIIVVVSHSNTLPMIAKRLSGKNLPAISDDEYANLFIITLRAHETSATLVQARYGE